MISLILNQDISTAIENSKLRRLFCIFLLSLILLISCSKNPVEPSAEPLISSVPIFSAQVDSQYSYRVEAPGSPIYSLTVSPENMTINSRSGLIQWTPTSTSEFTNKVVVKTQNDSGSDLQTFYICVSGLEIEGWTTSNLSSENIHPGVINRLLSLRLSGSWPRIHSIVIVKNGKLVLEEYYNGRTYNWPFDLGDVISFNRNTLHQQCCVTKSIISILTGIALEHNLIDSLSESVFDYFPQYSPFQNWDTLKSKITLEHLITMTAGFTYQDYDGNFWIEIYPSKDWLREVLDLRVSYVPGNHWAYFSSSTDLLSAVIGEAAGLNLATFAKQYLFDPLEISEVEWYLTPTGRPWGGGCQKLRPIDMAKIGYMMINAGQWKGQQIISQDWIDESTLERNPRYGYSWWRIPFYSNGVMYKAIVASGAGGQRICLFPELQLVIVTTGGYYYEYEEEGEQHFYEIINEIVRAATAN